MIQSNFVIKKTKECPILLYQTLGIAQLVVPKTALVRESALAGWPAGRKF